MALVFFCSLVAAEPAQGQTMNRHGCYEIIEGLEVCPPTRRDDSIRIRIPTDPDDNHRGRYPGDHYPGRGQGRGRGRVRIPRDRYPNRTRPNRRNQQYVQRYPDSECYNGELNLSNNIHEALYELDVLIEDTNLCIQSLKYYRDEYYADEYRYETNAAAAEIRYLKQCKKDLQHRQYWQNR